ncbi:peptidase M20 domain-containing protein 2-like isoform X1 [Dermacentor andersoni]|uniref:peptidase M20 domain-containing protein 2-like isoform X1 n=2 Tax=Dermacentor andersoni TaxID=34620 RepID=UPI002155B3D0|nr:peptidase M20 domain-containing protein 2-like isoform X1 [Dermacentor andersoni]
MAADLKELVHNVVEANSQDLWQLSRFVWEHPELALNEVQCHDCLTGFLERRGFDMTRNYLLDTAFKAEFHAPGVAEGPCIALLCEFDALPDIGHACGHNLIAEASVGAALAVQAAMKSHSDIRGKLVVLGTPAEESHCGKELLIRRGALAGIDAALMSHPFPVDILTAAFAATDQLVVRFKGKAAHAAASPWEGVNALDAAVASYVNIGLLRQQLKPTARVHGVITNGGRYPNVIPEEAEMSYFVRAPSTEELVELKRRVEACFQAAAEAAGCTAHLDRRSTYMHVVHNDAMARAYRKHARALGVSFVDDVVTNLPPSGAATDCGNVSHRVPTIHPLFGVPSAQGAANHTREFAAVANAVDSQAPTLRSAKALALTVLDLLRDAELLGEAQREFAAQRLPLEKEEMRIMLSQSDTK